MKFFLIFIFVCFLISSIYNAIQYLIFDDKISWKRFEHSIIWAALALIAGAVYELLTR